MAVVAFPRRNLLAFPAGTAPGFDPSHPAAKGIEGSHGLSAVATANGFVNLASGVQGTLVLGASGATMRINQNGSAFRWSAAATGQYCQFPGTTIQDLVATMAVIGTYDSGTSNASYLWTDAGTTGGFRLDDTGLTLPFVIAVASGLGVPPTNVPIFYAASKTATAVNFVQVNLATGTIKTAIVANTSTALVPGSATQCIGSKTVNNTTIGTVSAAMWAPVGLSLPQLVQFAQDPWAFWYPNKAVNRVPAPAAATFLAAWANQCNITVLGTGTY